MSDRPRTNGHRFHDLTRERVILDDGTIGTSVQTYRTRREPTAW